MILGMMYDVSAILITKANTYITFQVITMLN